MNETPSDGKKTPKVTMEAALKAVQTDVETLVKKTLAGFELDKGDQKSRKHIFQAVVAAAAISMLKETDLTVYQLSRRASRGMRTAMDVVKPPKPTLTAIDGGLDDDGEEDIDEDDEGDESSDD